MIDMSVIGNSVCLASNGSGSSAVKVMEQGQVSNTSTYMTATFDSSIASYDFVEVHMFRADADIGYAVVKVPTSSATFYITGGEYTYTMILTPTTIRCSNYSGTYVNLYVDVFAYVKAI